MQYVCTYNICKQFLCNSTLKIGGKGNKIAKMFWCLGVLYSIIHIISVEKQFCFVFYFCGYLQIQTSQFQKGKERKEMKGKSFHSKPLLHVDTPHFSCCQHITSSHRLIAILPVAPHCLMWKAAATSNVTLNTDCLLTRTALHRGAQNTCTFFGRDDTPMLWQTETTQPWQSPGEQHSTWEHLVAMKSQRVLGCFLRVQWFASYRQAATQNYSLSLHLVLQIYERSLDYLLDEKFLLPDCEGTIPLCSLATQRQ